jgi:restriction endonuclease Mrr
LGVSTGVNILIWQNDIVSKVIHCSNDQEVQMNSLRQFLGVLVHERALGGVYIHRGKFNE